MMQRMAVGAFAVFAAAASMAEGEGAKSDSEIWNEGVELYRGGDATNALATLRPLMLSRTHGARAAEVVAKIEYDAARESGGDSALPHLEEAAAAAQIALRANPGDARANANFTRAVDMLPSLREAKHVNAVLAASNGKDPAGALKAAAADARAVMLEAAANRTNEAARAVRTADALAARTARLADVWIAVKGPLTEAAAQGGGDGGEVASAIDAARAKTREAATLLGDLDDGARYPLAEAEGAFNDFYKSVVMPPAAIRDDLVCQSNAWIDAAEECGRNWQTEALDYTKAFRAKFAAWAQAYEAQSAANTNAPPLTAEAKAEIESLSERLEALQTGCCKEPLPPDQEESIAIIRRIIELMPQDPNGGGEQQQQQQGGQSDKDQDKKDKDDKDKNDDKNRDDQESPPQNDGQNQDGNEGDDGKDDEKEDGDQDDGKDAQGEEDEQSAEEKEIEAVLKKAQERNDEHEAEKRARARKAKLPPDEKDW